MYLTSGFSNALFNILDYFAILQKNELEYFYNYPGDISSKLFEKFALF